MRILAGFLIFLAINLLTFFVNGQQPEVVPYRQAIIKPHLNQMLPEGIEFQEKASPEILSSSSFYGTPHHLPAHSLQPLKFDQQARPDWITWVLIVSLGTLALAQFLFSARMQQYFKATLGMRFFNQMERDGSFFNETLTYLLLFNYLSVMALLIIQTTYSLGGNSQALPQWHPMLLFLLVLGLLMVLYLLKGLVTNFIAWIFKTQQANSIYLKNVYLLNQVTGIIVLPLVAYSIYNGAQAGLIMAWILVLLAGLIKVSRNMIIGHKQAGFSPYYIILYLCAAEIAPLLVLVKAASQYLSAG